MDAIERNIDRPGVLSKVWNFAGNLLQLVQAILILIWSFNFCKQI